MDNQQICVKLIMDNLDMPFAMKTFDDRLVLQKAIYLAQEAGLNLGYFFSWYLKGPYSRRLASDGFSISDELRHSDESKKWYLDTNSLNSVNKIKPFFDVGKDDLATNLELSASVLFIVNKEQTKDAESITSTLQKSGKDFNQVQVETALGNLTKNGLIA